MDKMIKITVIKMERKWKIIKGMKIKMLIIT
jgi:hypothetical protein